MNRLQSLADRIRRYLEELNPVVQRIVGGWQRAITSGDEYYLDGVALNLHSLYSGLERIFELVAEIVDGSIPQGENWHQKLLQQMSVEISGIRPALISENVYTRLNEYRGFRHVVRNVYAYHFDPARIEKLVKEAPELFSQVKTELLAFADLIDQNK